MRLHSRLILPRPSMNALTEQLSPSGSLSVILMLTSRIRRLAMLL